MSDRTTRGRRSKVDLLPEDIRRELDGMLRDGRLSQVEILEAVNELIEQSKLPEDMQLSRPGLNRYASKMEAVGKSLREMREITQVWTAELGNKPTGEVTKLILEMARSQLFKALLNESEGGEVADVGMIKDAMLAVQRLESAAMQSHKREKEIRQAYAAEAAAAVSEELRGEDGMSEQLEDRIRQILLGKA
ncbi:DUF3486 family protein [Gallaecimonas xiamenensis]|uniref:DUF3486 family protein n=1 Tax=Gallaecimonas xiamenensis 3-C-1 TaxID=745411 RepID=K2JIZ4_9GAMM|nr:DUF3486 family protein [Gallaecimonas xiamenensis]EKE75198.1 hypothetical protein B3C1_07976 [Gallaecimonas xiamenensis 3-C-1]